MDQEPDQVIEQKFIPKNKHQNKKQAYKDLLYIEQKQINNKIKETNERLMKNISKNQNLMWYKYAKDWLKHQ